MAAPGRFNLVFIGMHDRDHKSSAAKGVPPARNDWQDHEALFARFEREYRAGKRPEIIKYLEQAGADRVVCLRELVKLDIEYQWKLGQEAIVEDYFEQFPELATASQAIDDLVEEELIVRQRLGKLPTRSELRRRFPEDSARLVAMLDALPKSTRSGRSAISTELDTMASLSGHAHDSSGGSRVNSLALQEGFRVEQYVLREPLGRGAFAVVWRASDEKLKRQVALKILRGDRLVDDSAAIRMIREARAAARLEHPAIVQVYDVGQIDGEVPYIVSQFVDGPTLEGATAKKIYDKKQAAEIVRQVALALDHAHRHGIIHRDIKPANILISAADQPMITDFGLAHEDQTDADPTLTRAGDILGTPAYMAPEQARGDVHLIDARTDVYAAGAVLYKLLTGRTPYSGTTNSVIQAVIHDRPAPIRKADPSIAKDLETITLKCLEKEPQDRYHSARMLADDLKRFLDGDSVVARPASVAERAWKWIRRNPRIAGMLAGLLALAGFLLGTGSQLHSVRQQRDRARAAETETQDLLAKSSADAGLLAMQRGRFRDAVKHFDQSLQLGAEKETKLRLKRIEALVAARELDAAIAELDTVLAVEVEEPYRGETLLWQAQLAFETQGPSEAAERWLEKAQEHYLAKDDLAYVDGMLSNSSPDAVQRFRAALALNPMHHRARRLLVTMLIALGRFDEALQEVQTARQLYASDVDFALLESLIKSGKGGLADAQALIKNLRLDERLDEAEMNAWIDLCQTLDFLTQRKVVADWNTQTEEMNKVVQAFAEKHVPLLAARGIHPPPRIGRVFTQLPEDLAHYYETKDYEPLLNTVAKAVRVHPEGSLFTLFADLQLMTMPNPEDFKRAAADRATFERMLQPFFDSLEHPAIIKNAHVSARIGIIGWSLLRLNYTNDEAERAESFRMFMDAAREIAIEETAPDSRYTVVIVRGAMAAKEYAFALPWLDHWETATYEDEVVQLEKTNQILSHRITIAEDQRNWSGVVEYAQHLLKRVEDHPQALAARARAKQHLQESLDQIE